MADTVFSVLCAVALRYVGAEGVDQIVALCGDHLSDQGQRLTKALRESNERAWKALEIALAGETLWNRLDRGEERAFRQQLVAYLKQMPIPELQDKEPFRKKCLRDLHDARKKALLFGRLVPEELARRVGPMAERADPQAVLAAEKTALNDIAAEFKKANLDGLAWLLEQQPRPGQSVLVVSVRYYFRRRVEDDAELARLLQFTAMENLTEAQQQGFRQLDEGLKVHAERVEEAVAGLAGAAAEMRDAALDLRSEMEQMHGEQRDFCARVLQMLERQQMHQRPVHAGDSLSIRTDHERQKVKEFLDQYRDIPEEQKRSAPALLNGLGKLQVAVGDYAQARQAFTRVAELSPDAASCAEGHYNAYRAALEQAGAGEGPYAAALAELKLALRFDAERFAPFPPDEYEPTRILGAGGFGVTFLCKKKLTGTDVAVKALQTEGLEMDVGAVLQEASTLDQLQHPAIIRLRHCGYAGAGRTRPFIEMEYFESQTLEEYVRKNGRLATADVLAVARPLAEALHAAHGKGILHRDVKPANLLVRRAGGRWEVRVIDFGLAMKQSLLETEASSSRRNRSMTGAEIAGTRHYAAPEQLGELPGVRVGPKSDVYGFAKTCCFALFQNTEPTLREWDKAPRDLGKLLSDCMARSPNDRPSGFAEVLKRLDEFMTPVEAIPLTPIKPPTARPKPPPVQPRPPERPLFNAPAPLFDPKPRPVPPVRPIRDLPGDEPLSAIPVRKSKIPDALPAVKSSPRLPKPAPPPPARPAPEAVRGPALALIILAVVSVVANIGWIFATLYYAQDDPTVAQEAGICILMYGVFIVASLFTAASGALMLMRKAFIVSLVGCCVAMLPIGFCCVGGLPIGVWGLITLLRPEVRGTFT